MDSFPSHFLFLLFFLPIQSLAQTNGIIPVNTSLTATKTSTPWLSPSRDFAVGFQFIEQNGLFLLSIWYHKLAEKTIVWYPFGGKLIPSGSKVELTAQFGLVLTDPQGNQAWSSPLKNATIRVDHGFIDDTGNFVLMGLDSLSLWESFEDPRDTLLPTQTMKINTFLISQMSDSSFSDGRFQFGMLEDRYAVLIQRNFNAYYVIDTNENMNFSNTGRQVVLEETGHLFIVTQSGERLDLMAKLETPKGDYYYRATLNFDGVFVIYRHQKSQGVEQNWTAIWSKPDNICWDLYNEIGSGICGFNSICVLDLNRRPMCECPRGYSLLDPNDKFGSCKPSFIESCDENGQGVGEDSYSLVELGNTSWYFNDYDESSISEDDCRNSCLSDCFCAVAIHKNDTCWKKRLPLSNGIRDSIINDTKAFLKVKKGDWPKNDPKMLKDIPGPRRKKCNMIFLGTIMLGSSAFINFMLLVVVLLVFIHVYMRKVAKPNNVVKTNLRAFSFEELVEATNGFAEELGRGAFGIVYKGIIDMGGIGGNVAVKKLDRVVQDGEKEFRAEVNVIGRTHHKNLVRLLGFCDHGVYRLLVYEYMSNGTVARFLFGPARPAWNLRTQIAMGVARGLLYLHEECTTQIIHCDIKPQNILLDDNYNGRIADFGLAKLLMINQSQTDTSIRGTKGYVAPEWFLNKPVTVMVDVYSFGVLLLEIVTCRKSVKASSGGEDGEKEILVDWVWDCFQQGKLGVLVEDDNEALNDMKVVERYVLVGIWCIQEDPYLRPNMRKVCQMLEGVVEVTFPPYPWPF